MLRPETGPTASHPLSGSCGEEASSRLAKSAEPNRPVKFFDASRPSASAVIASGIGFTVPGSCPSGAAGRSLFCWRSFIPFHYTPLAGEMQSCRPLFFRKSEASGFVRVGRRRGAGGAGTAPVVPVGRKRERALGIGGSEQQDHDIFEDQTCERTGRAREGEAGGISAFRGVLEGAVYRSLQKSYRSLHLDLTNPDFVV